MSRCPKAWQDGTSETERAKLAKRNARESVVKGMANDATTPPQDAKSGGQNRTPSSFREDAVAAQNETDGSYVREPRGSFRHDASAEDSRLPSALHSFDLLKDEKLMGKRIAFFLDYDGTLSPIVADADQAFMKRETKEVLALLANRYPTSIVTGRSTDKAKSFIQLEDVYYAGSHGFEIVGPKNTNVMHSVARDCLPCLHDAKVALEGICASLDGVSVEDNVYTVSVHYRNMLDWDKLGELEKAVDRQVERFPNLKKSFGRKVYELRPQTDWNKGKAVKYLMDVLDLNREDVIPVYIGDDLSDEDAFRELEAINGVGVLVAEQPRRTAASFSLANVTEVTMFLERCLSLPAV